MNNTEYLLMKNFRECYESPLGTPGRELYKCFTPSSFVNDPDISAVKFDDVCMPTEIYKKFSNEYRLMKEFIRIVLGKDKFHYSELTNAIILSEAKAYDLRAADLDAVQLLNKVRSMALRMILDKHSPSYDDTLKDVIAQANHLLSKKGDEK